MTDRAAELRNELLDGLLARGAFRSDTVAAVMRRVPRHAFLESFFRPSPEAEGTWREFSFDADDADHLAIAYADDALVTRMTGDIATSSISQPGLVGQMLELLTFEPGMRVLEIGAGTGYNAALTAELVGPEGVVVTVDIDEDVAEQAARLLAANGYRPDRVRVVTADGFEGAPDHAPFDRIVATVGCTDLSPKWIEQLAPGGAGRGGSAVALIPLEHGGVHPMMAVTVDAAGRVQGRIVARSGFIRIQGELDQRGPWVGCRPPRLDRATRHPLPARLASLVEEGMRSADAWDFHYDLALHERRVPWLLTLSGPGPGSGATSAAVDPVAAELVVTGEAGPLVERLLARYDDWRERGSPAATDYESEFVPLDDIEPDRSPNRWTLDRIKYRQIVRLVETPMRPLPPIPG